MSRGRRLRAPSGHGRSGRTKTPCGAAAGAAGQQPGREQRQQQPQQQERLGMDEAERGRVDRQRHQGLRRNTVASSNAATTMQSAAARASGTNRSR